MHFSYFFRQKELDSSGIAGTVPMDLSTVYDCLPQDLVIAKLEAYGLDTNSLRFFVLISWAAENKELKQDPLIVIGLTFFVGFLKDQY